MFGTNSSESAQKGAQGGAGQATANRDGHAMNEVSDLIQSAEAARESHIRATEQQSRSRKHLTSLIDIIEENLRVKRAEISQNAVQRERMVREYEQLRSVQNSLTMALEFGRADGPGDLAALSGAEITARTHRGPVGPVTATSDAGANPCGPGEDGSSEKGSDESLEDFLSESHSGFQRVIRKARSSRTKATLSG